MKEDGRSASMYKARQVASQRDLVVTSTVSKADEHSVSKYVTAALNTIHHVAPHYHCY